MKKETSNGPSSAFIEGKKIHDKFWGEAVEAEKWFLEEARKDGLRIPNDFPGMKNFIIQLTVTRQNQEKTPQEIAERYLKKLRKSQLERTAEE